MKLNNKGFTLVEILAVIIILGIMAVVAVPKFMNMEGNAANRMLEQSLVEINQREEHYWMQLKLSSDGYIDDATLFTAMDYTVGDLTWTEGPTLTGGKLSLNGYVISITRVPSMRNHPAIWSK